MIESLNIMSWCMIVLTSTTLTLFYLKKTKNFEIPQNVKAVFFVPFVISMGLMLSKIIPIV